MRGGLLDAMQFAPVSKRFGYAIDGDVMSVPLIPGLLFAGCPAAILRAVRAVVVNAVNAVLRRRLCAHVSEEVLETVTPAVADRNASPAIVLVCPGVRGVAPTHYAGPAPILGGPPAAGAMPVPETSLSRCPDSQTPACDGGATGGQELCDGDVGELAALAFAVPARLPTPLCSDREEPGKTNHLEIAKRAAVQVLELALGRDRRERKMSFSQDVPLSVRVALRSGRRVGYQPSRRPHHSTPANSVINVGREGYF